MPSEELQCLNIRSLDSSHKKQIKEVKAILRDKRNARTLHLLIRKKMEKISCKLILMVLST